MAEVMTTVLHDLCTELDDARREIGKLKYDRSQSQMETSNEVDRHRATRVAKEEAERLLVKTREDGRREREALVEQVRLGNEGIEERRRLRTELAIYVAELQGFVDTAKTKAERIALGHVVARLDAIRDGLSAVTDLISMRCPCCGKQVRLSYTANSYYTGLGWETHFALNSTDWTEHVASCDEGPTHEQIDASRVADGLPPIYDDEPVQP